MAELLFDPASVPEDERNFEPIPAGNYKMQVIESAIADTKSGSGKILTLTIEILEGPFANRRIWDRLNVQNDNPDAQRIAQRSLADLCLQLGIKLRNSDDLHFKPFTAKVTIQPDKSGQYGPQNRVRYTVAKPAGGAGQPARAASAAQPAARPAQGAAKPWNQPKAQQAAEPQGDGLAESFE